MLSRSPALRATRSKPYNPRGPVLQKSLHAGSRQLRSSPQTFAASNRVNSLSSTLRTRREILEYGSGQYAIGKRHVSSTPETTNFKEDPEDKIHALIDKITTTEAEILELLEELDLTDEYTGAGASDSANLDEVPIETDEYVEELTVEERVQQARHQFGDTLPEGYLNEEETLLYTRLYGEAIVVSEEAGEVEEEQESDQLFRQDGEGEWEEVPYEAAREEDIPVVYDMETGPYVEETAEMIRTREVAKQLGAELMLENAEEDPEDSTTRLHPRTREGKFSTDPSTIYPPKSTITDPISAILSDASNRHISEAAIKAFGGRQLPQSTRTAPPRAQEPQQAIGLSASQRFMSEMEASAYMAVLYPAMYASTLSVLTEIRKRLGPHWIRPLISKEGGPNVLDAGAGGAGVQAWRDVLRAEYELMVPDHPKTDSYPLGRATVLTGSDPLRLRASALLENTTFLPRLPDYLHTREAPTAHDQRPPQRKQFDLIIAPHALMNFEEDYERKEYVENLWQMLNPNGGVLVLLEKGHQKGFETIAGAREMLLKRHIASPGSTEYDELTQAEGENTKVQKEPGMIIAPCTNHERCPMYQSHGHSKGRKDHCHFEQRYIRPTFHQRIIGARDRNHEDLKFSYLAVQRGIDLRETEGIVQGKKATDAAKEGYEDMDEGAAAGHESDIKFHTLSLPRIVYEPMKRRGHVIFDMCTPAGKIERWTVPRSYSKQAYKDARKAYWGDLWALGAKTRIPRNLKLGDTKGESKKERLARRALERQELKEEMEEDPDLKEALRRVGPEVPRKKKGEKKVPSWKKQLEQKQFRRASKKHTKDSIRE